MKDVTIIIPTYNEEKYIEQAVLSAVNQAEFVIVSDNCSIDKTAEICKRLAKEYKNISFYEQEKNNGSVKNFEFLIPKIQTKYMINMGGHDVLEENYVFELKQALENNPDCVLSYSTFINIDDDNKSIGTYDVNDLQKGVSSNNVFTRTFTIIDKLSNCSIVFGLCRTKEFIESCDFTPTSAIDHVILCNLVSKGKFIQNKNTVFYRRYPTRVNNQEEYIKRISGENITNYDMTYMCKKQFELISNLPYNDKKKRDYFIELSKKSLQKRFSKYCFEEIECKLDILNNLDEKFIIYGAGTICDIVLEKLKNKIEYIIDKDVQKLNTLKNGIEIKNIDILFDSNLKIIISVMNNTIFDDLISMGLEYDRLISLNILDEMNLTI